MHKHFAHAATAAVTAMASLAAQAGIADIAGFEGVRVWEITSYTQAADFAAGDARLSAVLVGAALNGSSRDFGFFPGDENYDLFFSNADGTLNANGSYLTIDGNCFVPYGCFNINEVQLKVNGAYQGASAVVRAVYGRPNSFTPNSHLNAADGSMGTYTVLGDTIGMGADARMSITLSFANVPQVPEPQTYALMAAGLAGVAWVARRRRRAC